MQPRFCSALPGRQGVPGAGRPAAVAVSGFHSPRRFSRLLKQRPYRTYISRQCFRTAVSSMALMQTHHDNVVRLTHALHPLAPLWRIGELIAHLRESVSWFVRRRIENVAHWSARRRTRTGLSMAERARQRRELEQLSDRELRDIGITRYEIEFVLRWGSPR
jgi:uncharacterized protein YjiS (DUF1127 family)